MGNISPNLMTKMLSGVKKKIYVVSQISAVCIGICVYMHTKFLVGEIVDRFLGRALYG